MEISRDALGAAAAPFLPFNEISPGISVAKARFDCKNHLFLQERDDYTILHPWIFMWYWQISHGAMALVAKKQLPCKAEGWRPK